MGEVNRIIVVAPTEHLKTQWADAAARVHIRLDRFRNSDWALRGTITARSSPMRRSRRSPRCTAISPKTPRRW